jgi:hypothetical protein
MAAAMAGSSAGGLLLLLLDLFLRVPVSLSLSFFPKSRGL